MQGTRIQQPLIKTGPTVYTFPVALAVKQAGKIPKQHKAEVSVYPIYSECGFPPFQN